MVKPPNRDGKIEKKVVPRRVLVVDDEAAYGEMLQEFLASDGYQVVVAQSGHEAIEAYQRERPDVVLLDFWMPGKNGLETLRELKGLDPRVNVIMVTAALDKKLYRLVMAEGAFDYLTKPLNLKHLKLAIKTRLALLDNMR